jgi:hypothetical protein
LNFEPVGREFESLRARQNPPRLQADAIPKQFFSRIQSLRGIPDRLAPRSGRGLSPQSSRMLATSASELASMCWFIASDFAQQGRASLPRLSALAPGDSRQACAPLEAPFPLCPTPEPGETTPADVDRAAARFGVPEADQVTEVSDYVLPVNLLAVVDVPDLRRYFSGHESVVRIEHNEVGCGVVWITRQDTVDGRSKRFITEFPSAKEFGVHRCCRRGELVFLASSLMADRATD